MNNRSELEFLDILNIVSFVMNLANYDTSLNQGDKLDIINTLNDDTNLLLEKILAHLQEQDKMLHEIKEMLSNESG